MRKTFKSVVSGALTIAVAFSMMVTPAYATGVVPPAGGTADAHAPTADMEPDTQVYPIGDEAFYKLTTNADGSVSISYGDRDVTGEGWVAVPSAFIEGSEYNKSGETYAMYATKDGDIHIVPMSFVFEVGGKYYFDHATEDGAVVSVEVDTATNADPTMSTEFYLYIENGIDPDGITSETVETGVATEDPRVSYEITVETKGTFQIKATVPMYVCMYGYRGTGNIVTPTSDAYQLKNYSTQNATEAGTIVDITKLTELTKIYDENHSDEKLYAIAYKEKAGSDGEGTYTWWYSEPGQTGETFDASAFTSYTVIEDKNINASGQVYVIYEAATDEWTFAPAGLLEEGVLRESVTAIDPDYTLKEDFTFDNWNFGKEFAEGATGTKINANRQDVTGMALKVTELQAEPATWRLVDADTHNVSNLLRGELAMTLAPAAATYDASAVDLADCSAPLDITERGWILDEPTVQAGATEVAENDAKVLGLITKAWMAGSNVNAEGCTPVVKVTYTVTPIFNADDVVTTTTVTTNP